MEEKLRIFLHRELQKEYSPVGFLLTGGYFLVVPDTQEGQEWLIEVDNKLFLCVSEDRGIYCKQVGLDAL